MSLILYNQSGFISTGGLKLYKPISTFVWDKSLLFDGVDESVTLGNNLDNDGTNSITVSAWVKMITGAAGANLIFSKREVAGVESGYDFGLESTGKLYMLWNSEGGARLFGRTVASTIALDTWAHVIYTYDGSKTLAGSKIYLDDVLVSYFDTIDTWGAQSATNPASATIGNRDNLSGGLTGNLKEVAVWNSVISASDRADVYNGGAQVDLTTISNPPEHLWRLGDTAGDDATSVMNDTGSAGGINGTPVNMEAGDVVSDAP